MWDVLALGRQKWERASKTLGVITALAIGRSGPSTDSGSSLPELRIRCVRLVKMGFKAGALDT